MDDEIAARIIGAIDAAKGGDPLAPVDVVANSSLAAAGLRLGVGSRRAFANVRFQSLGQFASDLAAPRLANRTKLRPDMIRELGRIVAAQGAGPLAEQNPAALARALDTALSDLRDRSEGEIEAIRSSSPLAGEVVRLYEQYRLLAAPFFDRVDQMSEATAVVDQGGHSSAVVAVIGEPASAHERNLLQSLDAAGLYQVVALASGQEAFDAELLISLPSPAPSLTTATVERTVDNTRIVLAPDPDIEVRMAIEAALRRAADGVRFADMAIIFPTEFPYAGLVQEQLGKLGIAFAGKSARNLAQSAAGRFVSCWLDVVETNCSLQTVTNWLTSAPVANALTGRMQGHSAVSLAREARVMGGQDWVVKLRQWAEASQSGDSSYGSVAAQTVERSVGEAERLADFMKGVLARADRQYSTWTEWSRHMIALIGEYLALSDVPPLYADVERAAKEEIIAILTRLEALDVTATRVDRSTFFDAVRDELQVPLRRASAGSVFVGTLADARSACFDFVAACGFSENAFPGAAGLTGFKALLRTPDEPTRAEANERRFWFHANTAGRLWLSSPLADTVSRRAVRPSSQLLEVATALAGETVDAETLLARTGEPWLAAPSSFNDAVLNYLAPLAPQLAGIVDIANGAPAPAQALRFARARASGDAGEFDGVVGAEPELSLSNRDVSPSRLETWATCPFKYFLGRQLKLSPIRDEEDAFEFNPLDRGQIVHRVLERFLQSVPVRESPDQQWTQQEAALLQQIASEELDAAATSGLLPTGLLGLRERTHAEVIFAELLNRDNQLRSDFGVLAGGDGAEISFGSNQPLTLVVEREGRAPVSLAGRIDRVDYSADRQSAAVYDYKTGKADRLKGVKDDPVDEGKALQGALYRQVIVEQLRSEGVHQPRVVGAYWHVWEEQSAVNFVADTEAESRLHQVIEVIANGIEDGIFPMNPGKNSQNCRHCEFDSLCPANREQLVARKQDSPAIQYHAQLAARPDADEVDAQGADSANEGSEQ